GAEPVEAVVPAYGGAAVDHAVRADFCTLADAHVRPHDAIGSDHDIVGDLGLGVDGGGRMNARHVSDSPGMAAPLGLQGANGAHQLGFGHELAVDQRPALVFADAAA